MITAEGQNNLPESDFENHDNPEDKPAKAKPASKKKRKKYHSESGLSGLSGFLSFICLGAIAVFVFAAFVLGQRDEPGPLQAEQILVIQQGSDSAEIIDTLEQNHIVQNGLLFHAMTFLDGTHGKFRAGEYLFKAAISPHEIEDMLVNGRIILHNVTIPEGLTSEQIVERLNENDLLQGSLREMPREGSLLPETYKIARGTTREQMVTIMAQAQKKLLDEIWQHRASDLPIRSPYELVILASIVEKETGKNDERAHVASVFINRLQKNMKIQSDPTVVYGLVHGKGSLGRPILRADLDQVTPYNTYAIEGLPPGPITNPGRAALEAVANPQHTSDLYFVADGTGGHVFANNLADHNRNVQHWRQLVHDRNEAKDHLSPDIIPPDSLPASANGLRSNKSGALENLIMPDNPLKTFGLLSGTGTATEAAQTSDDAQISILKKAMLKQDFGKDSAAKNAPAKPANVKEAEKLAALLKKKGEKLLASVPSLSQTLSDSVPTSQSSQPLTNDGLYNNTLAYSDAGAQGVLPAGAHPKIFDVSEGTPNDPLLNKTYDLNFPKTVPDMKKLSGLP